MTTDNKPRKGQTMSQKPRNKMTKAELIKALDEAEASVASFTIDLEQTVKELFHDDDLMQKLYELMTDTDNQQANQPAIDEVFAEWKTKSNHPLRKMITYVFGEAYQDGVMEGHERGYAWGLADGIANTHQGYEAHHTIWNTGRILLRDGYYWSRGVRIGHCMQ